MKEKASFFYIDEEILKNSYNFKELLTNQFDMSWLLDIKLNNKLPSSISEDDIIDLENKIFSTIPPENLKSKNIKNDKSVIYKYNSDGFRSDEFSNRHDGLHILFAGCSETEGVGGNIEDAWSKMLYDLINKDNKCSGFFNLSKSGWGYFKIIINSMIYFEKYGYPDYLFIFLPNCQRKFIWSEKAGRFFHWQIYPVSVLNIVDDSVTKNESGISGDSDKKQYFEDFISFVHYWKVFEKFCKLNNIKMFFSTWNHIDRENLSRLDAFDNYIKIDKKIEYKMAQKYIDEYKKFPHEGFAKRDGHNGPLYHRIWSELFYNKFMEEINEKNI